MELTVHVNWRFFHCRFFFFFKCTNKEHHRSLIATRNMLIAFINADKNQMKGNIESAKFDIEDETAVCDESELDVGETSFSPQSQIKRVRFAQGNHGFEGLREPKWESKREGNQMKPEPYKATGSLKQSATHIPKVQKTLLRTILSTSW